MDNELEQLGERIAEHAAHLDAATHRLLTDIREFDRRGGWYKQGARSCAHWLSWRVGWTLGTARDRVRVAGKLGGLPAIDDALRRGEISYCKVRAMARVATPENESLLLDHARLLTGAQLEATCRKLALVQRHGEDPHPLGDLQRRYVRRRDTEDGMIKIEAVLHPEEAELVWTMLNHAATQLTREPGSPTCDDSAQAHVSVPAHSTASTTPHVSLAASRVDVSAEATLLVPMSPSHCVSGPVCHGDRDAATSGSVPARASQRVSPSTYPCDGAMETSKPMRASTSGASSPMCRGAHSAETPNVPTSNTAFTLPVAHVAAAPGGDSMPAAELEAAGSTVSRLPVVRTAMWQGAPSAETQELPGSEMVPASPFAYVTAMCQGAPSAETPELVLACEASPGPSLCGATSSVDDCREERTSSDPRDMTEVDDCLEDRASSDPRDVPEVDDCLEDRASSDPRDMPDERSLLSRLLDEADAPCDAVATSDRRTTWTEADQRETVPAPPASELHQRADATRRAFDRADALVAVAQGYLRGDRPNRSPIEITLTIPASTLCAGDGDPVEVGAIGESFVSREAARRLSCDSGVIEIVEDEQGTPLSVGRKRRTISGSLKRALHQRDKTCMYPGCANRLFLEGHHIKHWVDGGETSLMNGVLLCTHHHHFVHEYRYTIELGPDQRPQFRDPQGRLVTAVPVRPLTADLGWSHIRAINEPLAITAETPACGWDGSTPDYRRIVGHLLAANEPRPTVAWVPRPIGA